MIRGIRSVFLSGMVLGGVCLARPGYAQSSEEVSGTGKGTVGGALLGAELVLVVEAAFDVDPAWAYLLGGAVGAGGGGFAGHLLEGSASPEVSGYLLTGGLAMIIPTTVAVLSATAYDPETDHTEDRPPAEHPAAEPARPTALLGVDLAAPSGVDDLELGVPAVDVRELYSRREIAAFGVKQGTEVRVPVLTVLF